MYGYELHRLRSAELIRQAEHARLVREAVRGRRAERSAQAAAESESHMPRRSRHRHPRAA
ncbi:hypothetical protein [Streptomyces caeruleatus]|uniref:Uncharacterized protein n=1 Tax=Streptomyces caeruleatus TaxID=661399 RepID=A0A101U618_9ACTN|nr:hypothetical protein [Streptomyces caeruleatus]KUO04856.1 hypothetical protein AQJ67_08875 [Streptomyces caeruleatus]